MKEETSTFGALCVLKHLLPRLIFLLEFGSVVLNHLNLISPPVSLVVYLWRLSEAWHIKIPSLVEAVKLLLDEPSLGVSKALSEVCC